MDLIRLAAVLRERREALGISAAEIARRVGVSPTYVWMVELARPRKGGEPSRPGAALLEKWARALGMDERYARQLLLLAGYESVQPDERSVSRSAARSLAVPAPQSTIPPLPMAAAVPRPGEEMLEALFDAPVHFAPPSQLRDAVLAEELREVLGRAEEVGRMEEVAGELEAFLDFLRYRLERGT
jgi:transcriptional regulator with XRE-family HTH domain